MCIKGRKCLNIYVTGSSGILCTFILELLHFFYSLSILIELIFIQKKKSFERKKDWDKCIKYGIYKATQPSWGGSTNTFVAH